MCGCSEEAISPFPSLAPLAWGGPKLEANVHRLNPSATGPQSPSYVGGKTCVTAAKPQEQWKQMNTILQKAMVEIVGLSTRKRQHWFDEADREIQ